jgi:alpha-ribazole phosphatase
MKDIITTIDLIRHGEPVGGKKYRGQIDDPLSEKGYRQMREAVGDFAGWEHIVTSPLSRCSAFAHELGNKLEVEVSEEPNLMEVGFGSWEGKTSQELRAADPDIIRNFKRDPIGCRPEGAEALDAFYNRVKKAWENVLACHQGKHVLLVIHAGVIRMIIAHVLGIPLERVYHLQVESASLSRIIVEGEGQNALKSLLFHGGRV